MTDPCEPPGLFHHGSGPGHAIGRIRRHGTGRLARQLHRGGGGCLPGNASALVDKVAAKAVVPVGFAALAAAAPSLAASTADHGAVSGDAGAVSGGPGAAAGGSGIVAGDPGGLTGEPGGFVGGTGSSAPGSPGHHRVVTVGEPASLPILLFGLLALANVWKWFRPPAISRSRPGAANGRS